MLKVLLLTLLISTGTGFENKKALPFVVEGVITNEEKQPIENVFLYTVLGEEETVTNKKGEFSFKTYQSFPVKLVVQGKEYEEKRIEFTKDPGKLSIVLKHK